MVTLSKIIDGLEMVDDIVDLIWKFNGDKKLHDDVTMMIAKVGY